MIAVGLGGRRAGLGETVAFPPAAATDVETDELIDSCRGVATQVDAGSGVPLRSTARRFAS